MFFSFTNPEDKDMSRKTPHECIPPPRMNHLGGFAPSRNPQGDDLLGEIHSVDHTPTRSDLSP